MCLMKFYFVNSKFNLKMIIWRKNWTVLRLISLKFLSLLINKYWSLQFGHLNIPKFPLSSQLSPLLNNSPYNLLEKLYPLWIPPLLLTKPKYMSCAPLYIVRGGNRLESTIPPLPHSIFMSWSKFGSKRPPLEKVGRGYWVCPKVGGGGFKSFWAVGLDLKKLIR